MTSSDFDHDPKANVNEHRAQFAEPSSPVDDKSPGATAPLDSLRSRTTAQLGGPANLLRLQRAVGNAATTALIRGLCGSSSQPTTTSEPSLQRSSSFGLFGATEPNGVEAGERRRPTSAVVQRDAIFNAVVGSQPPGSTPAPTPDQLRKLNIDVGAELRRLAGDSVTRAAIEFQMACADVKAEIEKNVKQQAEMAALMIDIIAGFAAPAFAGAMASSFAGNAVLRQDLAAAAKRAGSQDPDIAWTATWEASNLEDKMRDMGISVEPGFLERVSGDNLKATFTGAAKSASTVIKNSGPTLSTVQKEKLCDQMGVLAVQAAQDLDRSLSGLQESEIAALLVSFDARSANKTAYADSIRRYFAEVLSIGGTVGGTESGSGKIKLVKMNAWGGPRLATVDQGTDIVLGLVPVSSTRFVSWVSPAMEQSALDRAGMTIDQVPEVNSDNVSGKSPPAPADSRIIPPPGAPAAAAPSP